MARLSTTTERLYAGALASFDDWLKLERRQFPVPPHGIAAYLRMMGRQRGASVVPVHLSAIARYHRACGLSLDTKHPAIQRVTLAAREQMRR